jgi:hypothetical protein
MKWNLNHVMLAIFLYFGKMVIFSKIKNHTIYIIEIT